MLFNVPGHLEKIIRGEKTQTSRLNKFTRNGKIRWDMQIGQEYRATDGFYTKNDDAIIIRCKRRWLQTVVSINVSDAMAEGGYTPEQFIKLWQQGYGEQSVYLDVKRYEFEFVRDNRKDKSFVKRRKFGSAYYSLYTTVPDLESAKKLQSELRKQNYNTGRVKKLGGYEIYALPRIQHIKKEEGLIGTD